MKNATQLTRLVPSQGLTRRRFITLQALLLAGIPTLFTTTMNAEDTKKKEAAKDETAAWGHTEKATLGGGCFWCTEAVFERFEGVKTVISGYSGGRIPNPTYKQICTGDTGHAEVIQIEFDPAKITYAQILEIFWVAHDPTTLNRQGADTGTQYRSTIMYHSEAQKKTAEESKKKAQANFKSPIVTEIVPISIFYKAEDYHQDYFKNNPNQPYCTAVIGPKLRSLEKKGILPAR
jgi:peptide-methionine (S)-S-oxide reductase